MELVALLLTEVCVERDCFIERVIVGSGAQLKQSPQTERGWRPNWEQTKPLRLMEASLVIGDTLHRGELQQLRQELS